MTISDADEFTHAISVLVGETSATEQYCRQAGVINHRKFRAKLKDSIDNGTDLEYTDSVTNTTAKLSEEGIFEIKAFQSFKAYMQNETGPKRTHPVDITKFSRNDYTSYLDDYDQDDPDVV